MARRVFVDSSAWFVVASASDGRHAEADALLRHAVARGIRLVTTNLILAEIHRLALVRMGIRPASALLDRIEASRLVTIVHASADHHLAAHRWLADRCAPRPPGVEGGAWPSPRRNACSSSTSSRAPSRGASSSTS